MIDFRILICEDDESDRLNIELHIKSVNRILKEYNVIYKVTDFSNVIQELENEYDLIILDLFDNVTESDKGSQVLMHNNENRKIPTIIYTSAGDELEFDINKKKDEYAFLINKFTKFSNSGDELKNFLKGYIITTKSHKFYNLYNSNDKKLNFAIHHLGETHFNYILYLFKAENEINDDIIVYPMTSGWSGAVLFKLKINKENYILKLSKNKDNLKDELEKAKKLYANFPSQLINHIYQNEYYSFDKTVYGFSIKNIENSTPLLTYILKNDTTSSKIETLFTEIYLKQDSLKYHYSHKKQESKDWTSIFEKINDGKLQWVKESYNDLKPIIEKFYTKNIDVDDFRRLSISNDYKNLNKSNLLNNEYNKELVLSHGDFHANNILIQSNERPFIIDTGALGYQYWTSDITRLIVSLFILGVDKDKIDYFDINRITYYIELGEKIIKKQSIEIKDSDENYNIIYSINWLINNIENIYDTQFSLFEFQLGLMNEFLQVSYRIKTVPPNKRALALILAFICLEEANKNANN